MLEAQSFTSVGSIIKYYRELKKISVTYVAEKTMIPERFLHALENDEKDITPSLVHTFSYIKQYASLLELDGLGLIELYKKQINVYTNSQNNDLNSNISNDNEVKILNKDNSMSEDMVSAVENNIDIDVSVSQKSMESIVENKRPVSKVIETKISNEKDTIKKDLNKVNIPSNGNGNGNGNGMKSKQDSNNLSNLVKNIPSKNTEEKDENSSKEIESAKEQAERIRMQARRDADKMIREAQEYSRQVYYESNKHLSDTRKYAEFVLTAIEKEFEKLLSEVKMGRQVLKKVENILPEQNTLPEPLEIKKTEEVLENDMPAAKIEKDNLDGSKVI